MPQFSCRHFMKRFHAHLGHIIRDELNRQQRTVTWFADNINCDRTTCYDIFARKFVNHEQLEKISIVLHHNFFRDLAEYEDGVVKKLAKSI